ncbi:hypothetical protein [Burkholderia gladioli]|uniref:hypothetical protein n=1 Tax=Burkholderia gladioli TaxID=28095 RepID=UPI00163F603C|nr:hypothetical protein [Burkholderia gladioli]
MLRELVYLASALANAAPMRPTPTRSLTGRYKKADLPIDSADAAPSYTGFPALSSHADIVISSVRTRSAQCTVNLVKNVRFILWILYG